MVSLDLMVAFPIHGTICCFRNISSSSAVVALTCEEEVLSFHSHVEDGIVKLAVVSEEGSLFLYHFSLSPLPPSPIACCSILQFVNSPPKVYAGSVSTTHC